MKSLLIICAAVWLIALAGISVAAQPSRNDSNRLLGAWKLVRLQRPGADGKLTTIDCCGMFVFTRDGHASVQVMEGSPHPQASAGANPYSRGGYEASYGTYTVDERSRTFVFHVEGALVPALIGKDLQRSYSFSGRRMIVKPAQPDERWSVVWERY